LRRPLPASRTATRELGDLVARRHPAFHRIGRHGAHEDDDVTSMVVVPEGGADWRGFP
jgi:hypothetical protein